jgi:hypothetical protein
MDRNVVAEMTDSIVESSGLAGSVVGDLRDTLAGAPITLAAIKSSRLPGL